MADLVQPIIDAALGPKLAEADGLKAESHSLPDLIKADVYLRGLAISGSGWGAACRPARVVLPAAIGPRAGQTDASLDPFI